MSKNQDQRFRAYCFTLNNYTPEEEETLQSKDVLDKVSYMIYGHEVAPTTGTPHLQGFVYFKSGKTLSAANRALTKRIHLEIARGGVESNTEYCSKDATDIFTYGSAPSQGKRVDLDGCRGILQAGGNMRKVTQECDSYQAVRMSEVWLKYHEKPRDFQTKVYWFFGATGTGKSRAAHEFLGSSAYQCDQSKWWEGYDGHSRVVMDEVRASWMPFARLLRLFDWYGYRVEYKGGTRQFRARVVVCTAPLPPKLMYVDCGEDTEQLNRRFVQIVEFTKDSNPWLEGKIIPFHISPEDDI